MLTKDLMSKVFKKVGLRTFYDAIAMTTRRLWVATDNVSIATSEGEPGTTFAETGHPQKEILYVIRGHLKYDDGRVVRDGEAVINLPDRPHPGRRGTNPTFSIEIKVPAAPHYLEMFRS